MLLFSNSVAVPCTEPQSCQISTKCQTIYYLQGQLSTLKSEIEKVCNLECFVEYKQSHQCLQANKDACSVFWLKKYQLDWNMHCVVDNDKVCALERLKSWESYKSATDLRIDFDAKIPCTDCTKKVKYYELQFDSLLKQEGLNNTGVNSPITDRIIGRTCGPLFMDGYSTSDELQVYTEELDAKLSLKSSRLPQQDNTLSNGAVVGIVVGSVGFLLMLLLLFIYKQLKKKKKRDTLLSSPIYNPSSYTLFSKSDPKTSSSSKLASEDMYISRPSI